MSRVLGVRRIVTTVFVLGVAAAGLAVSASSAGGQPRPEPNCLVPGREPAPAIIIEPPPLVEGQCAELEVTKVVNGTAPQGTIFRVVVQCEPKAPVDGPIQRAQQLREGQFPPFSTVLEFPATGGTQSIFIGRPSSCTLSETPPPGCTLASIAPSTVEMTQPNRFQALVTNNCEPPAEPVFIQGTIVVNNPAPAVVAAPRFTG
jgi:hypothetical protein